MFAVKKIGAKKKIENLIEEWGFLLFLVSTTNRFQLDFPLLLIALQLRQEYRLGKKNVLYFASLSLTSPLLTLLFYPRIALSYTNIFWFLWSPFYLINNDACSRYISSKVTWEIEPFPNSNSSHLDKVQHFGRPLNRFCRPLWHRNPLSSYILEQRPKSKLHSLPPPGIYLIRFLQIENEFSFFSSFLWINYSLFSEFPKLNRGGCRW